MKYISLVLILGISACTLSIKRNDSKETAYDNRKINQMAWLLDTWTTADSAKKFTEQWYKVNDSTYEGKGFALSGKDTVFAEKLAIIQRGNDLAYCVLIGDENDGAGTAFRFLTELDGAFIFENMTHDFPQRIVYKHPHKDSLYASVEGDDKGKFRRETFIMHRKPEAH